MDGSSCLFWDAATRAKANSIGVFPLSRPTSPFSIPNLASCALGSLGLISRHLESASSIACLNSASGCSPKATAKPAERADRELNLLGTFHVLDASLELAFEFRPDLTLVVAAAPSSFRAGASLPAFERHGARPEVAEVPPLLVGIPAGSQPARIFPMW